MISCSKVFHFFVILSSKTAQIAIEWRIPKSPPFLAPHTISVVHYFSNKPLDALKALLRQVDL